MLSTWSPTSWRSKPIVQQPTYSDQALLAATLEQLRYLPPLVTSWEVDRLQSELAAAQAGQAWLLQGGDCAETFADCQAEPIASKLKVLLQMSLAIVFGGRKKILRVGRMAGQYAKPRSSDLETIDGQSLPSYRGDIINAHAFDAASRICDPQRLLRAYERSALTMNFIRSLSEGGFADLHHPENWNLLFVTKADAEVAQRYQRLVDSIGSSLRFMENLAGYNPKDFQRVDFFVSHEALHLEYEAALTRASVRGVGYYNLSTHLPWIGERTRDINGAHVEYARGIKNPLGIKVGPKMSGEELLDLLSVLNPDNQPGRIVLIHRMGVGRITDALPGLIEAVQREGTPVLWVCDPMHGNTIGTAGGRKTRRFEDICQELHLAFSIHRAAGSRLGGAHLELTGENVTECTGGAGGLTETDLELCYQTQVDPRLNYEQALEIAFEIAEHLRQETK